MEAVFGVSEEIRYPVRVRTYSFPLPEALAVTRIVRYLPSGVRSVGM